jgi:hypothetical protein
MYGSGFANTIIRFQLLNHINTFFLFYFHEIYIYAASFLGIESPTPYQLRDTSKNIQQGLNFAYGGSGVFPSTWAKDSLSVQIDQFEQLLDENEYSQRDLDNSVALVSTGGNDYSLYSAAKKGSNDVSSSYPK